MIISSVNYDCGIKKSKTSFLLPLSGVKCSCCQAIPSHKNSPGALIQFSRSLQPSHSENGCRVNLGKTCLKSGAFVSAGPPLNFGFGFATGVGGLPSAPKPPSRGRAGADADDRTVCPPPSQGELVMMLCR